MPSVAVNSIEIYYESMGDPSKPCLLLIGGFNQQLTDWPLGLCTELASDFHVVRFDSRDSGLSTHMRQPGYSLDDMADDTLGLLDAINVRHAHIMGVSMGGMIAQIIALRAPDRVKSLVLISTSTGDPLVGQADDDIRKSPFIGPADDFIEAGIQSSTRWTSWDLGVTEESLRERIRTRIERSYDPSAARRQLAAIVSARDRTVALKSLDVPVRVVHGSEDPLVHVDGGRALAAAIPGANMIEIHGLRHDLPEIIWPQLILAVHFNLVRS